MIDNNFVNGRVFALMRYFIVLDTGLFIISLMAFQRGGRAPYHIQKKNGTVSCDLSIFAPLNLRVPEYQYVLHERYVAVY